MRSDRPPVNRASPALSTEVQVYKVSVEMPAPAGDVVHVLVDEEAEVRQGTPIARID